MVTVSGRDRQGSERVDDSHKYVPAGRGSPRFRARGSVLPPTGPVLLPPPGQPTSHAPGTAEKVAVMCDRARRREALCHPFDARYSGCAFPLYWSLLDERERALVVETTCDSVERPTSTLY